MKKTSFVALASLIALSGTASAQTFDLNAMPLSNIPTRLDRVPTGLIAANRLLVRNVTRDAVSYSQYYTLNDDGSIEVVPEKQN